MEVNSTDRWYRLDDGSGVRPRVQLDGNSAVKLPALNAYVSVTGISSCELSDKIRLRLVLVSTDSL